MHLNCVLHQLLKSTTTHIAVIYFRPLLFGGPTTVFGLHFCKHPRNENRKHSEPIIIMDIEIIKRFSRVHSFSNISIFGKLVTNSLLNTRLYFYENINVVAQCVVKKKFHFFLCNFVLDEKMFNHMRKQLNKSRWYSEKRNSGRNNFTKKEICFFFIL